MRIRALACAQACTLTDTRGQVRLQRRVRPRCRRPRRLRHDDHTGACVCMCGRVMQELSCIHILGVDLHSALHFNHTRTCPRKSAHEPAHKRGRATHPRTSALTHADRGGHGGLHVDAHRAGRPRQALRPRHHQARARTDARFGSPLRWGVRVGANVCARLSALSIIRRAHSRTNCSRGRPSVKLIPMFVQHHSRLPACLPASLPAPLLRQAGTEGVCVLLSMCA